MSSAISQRETGREREMDALSSLRNARPPITSYAPSIWADTFSKYSFDDQVQQKYEKIIEELKQEVRCKLMVAATPLEQMIFIDTLERLGLAYHFEMEIEQKLQEIYDNDIGIDDYNLFTTALRFRLLRQHQHHISCDVFHKFLNKDGKFEGDAEGLLSLYEAAHIRFRGDKILEEAERFTKHELSSMKSQLQSPLKEKVIRALERPLHRDIPIIYARLFISIYEKDDTMDEHLLKLAKFNFSFLQNIYKKELYELTRWWNKFDLQTKLPYLRDRLVEAYLWGVAYHFEPQYSYVRKGLVLGIKIIGVMDDTYDNYATVNEAQLFTEILDKWSMDESHRLPDYMKTVLHFVMSAYEESERDAEKNGKHFASTYFKETIQQLGRAYNQELKWVMEKQLPSFQDYLKNSEITSCIYLTFASIIPGLKSLTQETIDWMKTEPSFAVATGLIGRYWDDIGSHKRENKGGKILTVVDCYMKQYGVSEKETIAKFAEAVEDAWKDVNEGWVKTSSIPKEITVQFLNYSRLCDASYNKNNGDGYTDPRVSKPNITALFVDPLVI